MAVESKQKSGILIVDKVEGITSHDLVARVRKTLAMKKIGHAGTLDPFATGVMILLVGEGTKLSNYLMEGEKRYRASIVLGERRDTGDLTGHMVEQIPFPPLEENIIVDVLASFKGNSKQVPPMYSAIKKNGVPLYKYARKGIDLERSERDIFISEIKLINFDADQITIDVTCSKGTYIRTLAEDIARALGTCGYLGSLRRLENGSFSIDQAISTEDLGNKEKLMSSLIPLHSSLKHMSSVEVKKEAVEKILNGRHLMAGWLKSYEKKESHVDKVKILSPEGSLLSIGELFSPLSAVSNLPEKSVVGKSLRVFNNI
ncbi:MAG: tRNA pseudouridine(55) synthase TruB [Deltaproteobacteria bacterium]|nr:tRNA pseudouridine(55) synthase TruB [Deltaproteobacteria bacterium]